jgi:phosphatidylglycerophosphatase A
LGLLPVAPGTWGALPGVAIFAVIHLAAPVEYHTWLIGFSLAVVSILTVVMSPWAERYWNKKDPGNYVLDEVAGFLMTVLLFRSPDLLLTIVWAFPVTRAVDIIKPPPCRRIEHLHGGWGILLDDLMASIYAAAILHGIAYCFPHWFGFAG